MQSQEKSSSKKLKQKWFDFTMELVSNQLSMNLYIFFIVIQSLQFIGYHNNGMINYHAVGFESLGSFLKYINFLPFMLNQNINIFIVPLFTVLSLTHMILMAIGFHAYHKKIEKMSKSVADRDFHKNKLEYFINVLMISFCTFLTIPICQTSVSSIYCQDKAPLTQVQNCYSSSQAIIAILGTINMIWLVMVNLYFSLYYYNRNPFSANFLTCSSNWWNLGKFAIKITPMLYFSYDPYLAYPVLFLIMINGCYAGYIGLFRILIPFYRYNFHLQKIIFYIESMVLLTNFCFIILYALNTTLQNGKYSNSIVLISWTITSLLFSKLTLNYFVSGKKKLIIDIHSLEKIKLDNVLEYMIYLIFQTQRNLELNIGGFSIANIAKTHKDVCESTDCYCRKYFDNVKKKDYNKDKQTFYTMILAIVDRVMKQNRRATAFYILKAYILYYKMQSQIKAATTIAVIMMDKLDFSDEMLVKGLLFELNNQYTDTRDMQIYRKFNQQLLHQEQESMKLVNYYIQYWEELIDQNSSIPKLHNLLKLIKKSKDKLHHIVQTSLGIYRNHVRVLLLYKNFLREVLNDYVGFLRYEEKYRVGLKEHKLTNVDAVNTIQFRPNENLLVINFTRKFLSHSEIMGNFQILNISSNVKQVLGFTNAELRDQSLNKMIPRIYHKIHDTFIDAVLDKKDAEIVSFQYRIFPINSEGHIIECNIISKFMPSVSCGINIVSFLEQCDAYKDEFFIIYDKTNGMVDAMNEGAEKMLKDASRRKTSEMLAIPDHINDLIPNWDYKNEVWKDRIGRGKSMKSINSGSELKYELKSIEVVRSDGLETKYIKIIKFKGDFFMKMFSFDNYQSYRQSNTIQQYLEYQKNNNNNNSFSKMDSNQLEDLISADTHHLIQRDREKKKTMLKMQKIEKVRQLTIEPSPPKISKVIFISVEIFLFCLAIGLTIYEFIISNNNISTYIQDSKLLINVNNVQFILSDSTYILSLTVTQMAYTSNMSLPYSNFQSSIELMPEIQQLDEKLVEINEIMQQINPIFITKINNGELQYSSLNIQVKYLLTSNSKQFYLQKTDVLQAVYQFISYATDISYRIAKLQEPIQTILSLPNYFYIFANNIHILPEKLLSIKDTILNSINNQLNKGLTLFIAIKLLNSLLILFSVLGVIGYYKYIYRNYIMQVLKMYQNIKVDQIKIYQEKCHKYKHSLTEKTDTTEKTAKNSQENQNGFSNILNKCDQNELSENQESASNLNQEEEQKKLIAKTQIPQGVYEQQLSFQSLPKIWRRMLMFVIWILFYGILLFAICFSYFRGTQFLQSQIAMLNRYTIQQNSVVHMRLFSQLSLNMLNYWDQNYLNSINQELQIHFVTAVQYMDDISLNFTQIKPEFARKYGEMRYVQSLVIANNRSVLNQMASQIQAQLQDMDSLIQYLNGQGIYYEPIVEADAESIATTMNICIGLQFIFILMYWLFGVRITYYKLLKEHESTYQMYNIISYNLRKEIEKTQ